VIPEIEQRVFVTRYPIEDLRRRLAGDADRQAVGDDDRNIGNRDGEARPRPSRLQDAAPIDRMRMMRRVWLGRR